MVGLGGKIGTAATLARRYIFDAHDGGTLRLIARLDDTDSIQRFLRDHKDALCAAIEGTLDISGVQLELRAAEVPKGAMSPSERARAARASEEAKRRNTLGQHPVVQEFVRNLGAKIVLMNTDISVLAPPEPQLEL